MPPFYDGAWLDRLGRGSRLDGDRPPEKGLHAALAVLGQAGAELPLDLIGSRKTLRRSTTAYRGDANRTVIGVWIPIGEGVALFVCEGSGAPGLSSQSGIHLTPD